MKTQSRQVQAQLPLNEPRSVAVIGCVCVLAGAEGLLSSMLTPILPSYAKKLHTSTLMIAVLFSLFPFAVLASSVPLGYLSGRLGRTRVMYCGVLLTALTAVLFGMTSNLALMCVYRFLSGVGSAATWSATYALLTELYPFRSTTVIGFTETATGFAAPFIFVGALVAAPIAVLPFALTDDWIQQRAIMFQRVIAQLRKQRKLQRRATQTERETETDGAERETEQDTDITTTSKEMDIDNEDANEYQQDDLDAVAVSAPQTQTQAETHPQTQAQTKTDTRTDPHALQVTVVPSLPVLQQSELTPIECTDTQSDTQIRAQSASPLPAPHTPQLQLREEQTTTPTSTQTQEQTQAQQTEEQTAETIQTHTPTPKWTWAAVLNRTMVVCALNVLFIELASNGLAPLFADYLSDRYGFSLTIVGLVLSATSAAYAVLAPFVGHLTRHSGAVPCIFVGLLILVGSNVFVGPIPLIEPLMNAVGGSDKTKGIHIAVLVASFFGLGLGTALAFVPTLPVMLHSVGHLGPEITGAVSGSFYALFSIGQTLGPFVGIGLCDFLGFQWTGAVFGFALAAFAPFIFLATDQHTHMIELPIDPNIQLQEDQISTDSDNTDGDGDAEQDADGLTQHGDEHTEGADDKTEIETASNLNSLETLSVSSVDTRPSPLPEPNAHTITPMQTGSDSADNSNNSTPQQQQRKPKHQDQAEQPQTQGQTQTQTLPSAALSVIVENTADENQSRTRTPTPTQPATWPFAPVPLPVSQSAQATQAQSQTQTPTHAQTQPTRPQSPACVPVVNERSPLAGFRKPFYDSV